jgi:hypothetical protein
MYNDTATWRVWKVGTHRLIEIVNGPSHFPPREEDMSDPEMPANVEKVFDADWKREQRIGRDFAASEIFADFEICPLEPEQKGVMQMACMESAKNIVIGLPALRFTER